MCVNNALRDHFRPKVVENTPMKNSRHVYISTLIWCKKLMLKKNKREEKEGQDRALVTGRLLVSWLAVRLKKQIPVFHRKS